MMGGALKKLFSEAKSTRQRRESSSDEGHGHFSAFALAAGTDWNLVLSEHGYFSVIAPGVVRHCLRLFVERRPFKFISGPAKFRRCFF